MNSLFKESLSLRNRLIIIIFFITFLAGLVSSVLSINSSQAALLDNYIGMALNEQFRIGYAIKSMSEYREFTEEEINTYLLGTVRNAALSYSEYYNAGNAGASFRISSAEAGNIFSNVPDQLVTMFSQTLEQSTSVSYHLSRCDGRIMVFASSNLNIYQKVFRLDYALDISVIQSLLSDISRKAAVQLFVMEILLFIFISIVVSRALRPLNVLREHTQKIANGLYDERVKVFRGDEVGQLAASVNQMSQAISESVESLKEAAHTKELLASNLAHELKTPLTSVVAYADYAIQKDLGKEEMNGILEYIRKEGRRLSDLSDKILKWNSISRLDSIDIKPCRPQRVIEQALYTLRPMAQAKNQLIDVNCHVEVIHADEALFVSLIVNLTKNALNASADSDTVRLFINNSGCGDLVLCVEDYGIGIQNTELEKITEPFYMVDKARDRSKGGSGLGLSLCAAIVNTHKGSMRIDSVYGEGTQVAVTIPQG